MFYGHNISQSFINNNFINNKCQDTTLPIPNQFYEALSPSPILLLGSDQVTSPPSVWKTNKVSLSVNLFPKTFCPSP